MATARFSRLHGGRTFLAICALSTIVSTTAIATAANAVISTFVSESFDASQSDGHRLVGLGCGAERLTLTAMEEDHFPACDTIATPSALCGPGVSASDCVAYMGDGW